MTVVPVADAPVDTGPRLTAGISGPQKAAILLVQLGKERAAAVMSRLSPPEVDEITAEIVKLRQVSPEMAEEIIAEFHSMISGSRPLIGGLDYAAGVLESSVGKDRARGVLDRLAEASVEAPFAFLHQADPQQILGVLSNEHPQTIAVVLAHLRPEQASLILSGLEKERQADIAHRVATMGRLDHDTVRHLEEVLYGRTSTVLQASTNEMKVGGLEPLVEIINKADRSTERSILEGLDTLDKKLAEEIRARLFVFEDIVGLEDRAVQLVLRQVDAADLARALKGVTEPVRQKVLKNMSERASQNLVEEIELLGRIRLSEVEESQAKVVQGIRALEESGQIVIARGGDDEFVA